MKIVIFMKNWLGDVLFQLPAVEMIRSRYPKAEIICAAPSRCREILEAHPAIDRVLVFDEKKEHRLFWKRLQFGFNLRKENADQGYLFHRSRTRAFLLWLAGVKARTGYAKGRQFFLSQPVAEPTAPLHHADYFVEMLVRAGFEKPVHPPVYRFYFSEEAQRKAEELLKNHHLNRYVCFHLGANWSPKRWPTGHFSQLAEKLWNRWQIPVVLTGGCDDQPLAAAVMTNTQTARLTSLIGQTDLGSLAALFAGALFVVSGDSGPMHIASGAGARVVALFGPTNPDLTGPRGAGETVILKHVPQGYSSPWYGEEMPAGGWLENITPEEVITAIERHGWHQNRHVPKSGKPPELSDTDKKALSERKMKILFVTLSNIGDVILTTPVLMTLASKYPQAEVTAVVGPRAKGILEDSRYVHRLVIYNKKAGWKEQLQFLKEIRKVSYDLVVDLRNTAIPYLVRARKRSPLFRRLNKVSFRERHLEVLGKMGIRCDSVPVFDFFSEKDDASLDSKLKYHGVRAAKDWILIAPAAASELKTWKLDGFRDVVRKLLTEQSADILIVGDKREGEIAKPLVHLDSARVHNLAGLTTLRELAALIARASLLVANDSAVMHLGYELGCPVVAVFGPTHSEKYGHGGARFKIIKESFPCVPCESPVCRLPQRICLDQLPAEKVIEACREFLHAHHL